MHGEIASAINKKHCLTSKKTDRRGHGLFLKKVGERNIFFLRSTQCMGKQVITSFYKKIN